LGQLAGWSALMTPLSVFLHELGHYAAARAFGYPARLKATSVAADLDQAPALIEAAQSFAGPAVTLLITIVAARLYARDRRRLWALALGMAAPHRYLVVTGYVAVLGLLALRGRPFGGTPNFDEYNTAQALGLPIIPVAVAITALLIAYWTWLVLRIPKGSRISCTLAIIVGAGVGMYLWVAFVTPLLAAIQ